MAVDLQPGACFDQYVLERRLGGGGFGDVWLSHDANGRNVALKVLTGQYATSEVAGLRAEIELLAAQASSRSSHIVRVLGGGSEPAPFVVMEYIEGEDLSQLIAQRGALSIGELLNIAEGIADALATLQRAGIIHRDIKPANVIIDTHGVVKLTDFGIAKIVGVDSATATGQVSLSMAYAAPEVWDGKATHLSDHYAFGTLLFQCLTGRAVFNGNYAEIYRHHLHTTPNLDSLPAETPLALREMIGECLAKAPEQRPQNATLLLVAVEAARKELAGNDSATVFFTPSTEPKRLGPWVIVSRSTEREWTFVCGHQTSGEKAIVEVHFSDDLEYAQLLRKAVDVNPRLVPLGAERLLGTSRLVLRPGEAWQSAPNTEFQFWIAREVVDPSPTRPISTAELRTATEGLNTFLDAAKATNLRLDMRAANLALRPDASVLIRRPGLPPFPSSDAMADVIAFLEMLPVYQEAPVARPTSSVEVSRPAPTNLEAFAPLPAPAVPAPSFAPVPPMAPTPASAPPAVTPIATAPAAARRGGGSKGLVVAGGALAAIVAVVAGAVVVLGGGKSNTKDPDVVTYASPAAATTPSAASVALVAQGVAAVNSKDFDGANKTFTKAIEADPKNGEAYYRRGLTYAALIKPDLALSDYGKAIQLAPTMASYYVTRGDLYRSQKKADLAVPDYTKALTLDPQSYGAYFGRGSIYGDSGNPDGAVADLTKAIELNPQSTAAYNNRGLAYEGQNKNDLAIQDFTKAISIDPKAVLPWANRGHLYYNLKRYDESVADYNKVIEIEPNSIRYNARGVSYAAVNKPDLAAADYNKSIQLDPKYPLPYYNLSIYYYNQKRYDEALASDNKALELDPSYYLAYYQRGIIYKVQAKTDLARADFEKAKTLAKTPDDTQRAQTQIDSLR